MVLSNRDRILSTENQSIFEASSLNTSGIFSNSSILSLESKEQKQPTKLHVDVLSAQFDSNFKISHCLNDHMISVNKKSLHEISPNEIEIIRRIGQGEFGDVFEGTLIDIRGVMVCLLKLFENLNALNRYIYWKKDTSCD